MNISDIQLLQENTTRATQIITVHAIDPVWIIITILGFVFLSYWYVRVTKNRSVYESWTNPNGHVINLYKKVRLFFYLYVITIILLGGLQIILLKMKT